MTFEYNGLVWFQTIGLKETAVSDQSRFQANGGAVYNTPAHVQVVGYRLNRLDEPVFMAVPKPMLTEFGIHHRLESCVHSGVFSLGLVN